MSGHGTNPIFCNKKINAGRPEHSLTPHPLYPATSHEKFNATGIQDNGIWNHTGRGYGENKPFFNLPYFTFRFPFTEQ